MKIKDLVRHELIGLYIEILGSNNQCLIGIKGKIVDETKNTLSIKQTNETKKIMKDQVVLMVKINNQKVKINGKVLVGRPEDRLKK